MKRGPSLTLRQALAYEPVELEFGTSGLRGLVKDITDLEAYVAVRAFLDYLLRTRGAAPGGPVCLAGDLRPSTESILVPVCRAVLDAGFSALSFGRIPSPALLFCAMKRGAPGIMVTGSHIPFDRNGIKLTRKDGEVLKPDEKPIREAMHSLRQREYGRPFADSMFDERGALKPAFRPSLPSASADAGEEYVKRYTSAFPPGILAGKRILVYQHSAVGRDILVRVLDELGARTIPAGRSDTFVAVDTEAVNQEMMAGIQALADAAGPLDAVVSTDGDSDRPLVLGVEGGRIRFYPGDVLGIVTADYLGARQIAVPVSVNDAVDIHFESRGVRPVKTRIGSPYVIAAMREVGWEANGGFLTAAPLRVPGGGMLSPLPTRDALLPILSALCAGPGSGSSLGELFSKLPPRFGGAALVRPFAQERGRAIVRAFSPADGSIVEARVGGRAPARWTVRRADGPPVVLDPAEPLSVEMDSIRDAIERCFTAREGFPPVLWMNWLDGVRIGFENSDITHVRPSGNAPEMRVYAAAGTPERAEAIAAGGAAPGGTLSLMDREAGVLRAVAGFRSSPSALLLEGAVQHYSWGGFQYIPALIGRENPDRVPFAELWIGANPVAPAAAVLGETRVGLDRLVAQAAREILGERDTARFGGRLPFLMKVLDARTMLSIQAHPTRAQAAAGFARENAAGIPLDSPLRTYRDDNHKPEVHVCLTEFWMLHGFRPLEEIGRGPCRQSGAGERDAGLPGEITFSGERGFAEQPPAGLVCPGHDDAAETSRRNPRSAYRAARGPRRRGAARTRPSGLLGASRRGRDASPRRIQGQGDLFHLSDEPAPPPTGSGHLPARGNAACLPGRNERRVHGELGQCPPGRPDAQERGHGGAAADRLFQRRSSTGARGTYGERGCLRV